MYVCVVRFVDIGGIAYLHCLKFLFKTEAGLFTYFARTIYLLLLHSDMLTFEGFYELEMHILRNKNAPPTISNIEHIHDDL
jgi:hypothetical protein